jgi:5-methylcytosine-specific restriction endonuclease McrA
MLYQEDKVIMFYCNYLDNLESCPNYRKSDYVYHKEIPSRYISKSTRYEILKRQKWCCNICGIHLKYSENHSYGDVVAHIDHIHPFSQWESYDGDINEPSNLEALCPECNMKKYSKNGF